MQLNKLTEVTMAPRSSRTLALKGGEITVREIRRGDKAIIERLRPMPVAPARQDPSKGSLSDPVPDYTDIGYREALTTCLYQRQAGLLAVACEFEDSRGHRWESLPDDKSRQAWLAEAVECAGQLSTAEFDQIQAAIDGFAKASGPGGLGPNA